MSSSKHGNDTSGIKIGKGVEAIEAMILHEELRIANMHPYKDLDLLAIVLNSGDLLQAVFPISHG
jgi:hypothetical protein